MSKKRKPDYKNLIEAQEKYIKLLQEELDETATIAWVHGWRSHRFESGMLLRRRISSINKHLNKLERKA